MCSLNAGASIQWLLPDFHPVIHQVCIVCRGDKGQFRIIADKGRCSRGPLMQVG